MRKTKQTVVLSLRLPPHLVAATRLRAQNEYMPVSTYLRRLIAQTVLKPGSPRGQAA